MVRAIRIWMVHIDILFSKLETTTKILKRIMIDFSSTLWNQNIFELGLLLLLWHLVTSQNHWLLTVILELHRFFWKFSLETVRSLREVGKKRIFFGQAEWQAWIFLVCPKNMYFWVQEHCFKPFLVIRRSVSELK